VDHIPSRLSSHSFFLPASHPLCSIFVPVRSGQVRSVRARSGPGVNSFFDKDNNRCSLGEAQQLDTVAEQVIFDLHAYIMSSRDRVPEEWDIAIDANTAPRYRLSICKRDNGQRNGPRNKNGERGQRTSTDLFFR